MKPLRAYTVFCEYMRTESAGTDTLLGVIPGAVHIATPPDGVDQIGIQLHCYSHIELSTADGLAKNCIVTIQYNGVELVRNVVPDSVLVQEFEQSKIRASNKATIISRVFGNGMIIPAKNGWLQSVLNVDGDETIIGELEIGFLVG